MNRMRITLSVAIACIIASLLAAFDTTASHPLLAWLVHTDVQHLGVDLLTWTAFGAWLERRAGAQRMTLWVVAGLATSLIAHALIFPAHGTLYGLSAVTFFIFAAGLTAYALDRPWGWAMLLGIAFVLGHEWITGGTSAAESLVNAGFGPTMRLLPPGIESEPVPAVHIACTATGIVFGALAWRQSSKPVRPSRATLAGAA